MTHTQAIIKCAEWLLACRKAGWPENEIPMLEKLWWEYHDEHGNLKKAG